MSLGEQEHILDRKRGGPHERVEARHRLATRRLPSQVVGSAGRRSDWQLGDMGDLITVNPMVSSDNACRRMRVAPNQLNWLVVVDPIRAMQR